MTRVIDVQDPLDRVADVRRRMTANADEIEAVIAGAEREQRSDLSRREQARYQRARGSRHAEARRRIRGRYQRLRAIEAERRAEAEPKESRRKRAAKE